jgi:hypothetical protein
MLAINACQVGYKNTCLEYKRRKMNLDELQKRVQFLEDLEAIKTLKFRYAEAVNDSAKPEEMVKLFTENAVWEGTKAMGRHEGREAILKFFQEIVKRGDVVIHYFVQPHIEINDNKARGRWYMWCAPAKGAGGKTKWVSAIEDEKYEKINGKWLLSELKVKNERTGELLQDETPSLQ